MASLTLAGAPTNLAHPMTTPITPAAFEGDARGGARVAVRGLSKTFEHGGRLIHVQLVQKMRRHDQIETPLDRR